jgi:capsular polysaccharide transport system permease protein
MPSRAATSGSDAEAGIEARGRERAAAQRVRRRKRLVSLAVIVAPVLLALGYSTFVAVPRYDAEARFAVRSSSAQAMPAGGVASLLTTGDNAGLAAGFVDGWAVSEFLDSRDCMRQVDQRIGLRQRLAHAGIDPVNRLARDANDDDLYRAYLGAVKVSYNMMEQVDVMKVSAFSRADAAAISEALIDIAQDFVNRMDEKGLADALKVSRRAVTLAEGESKAARAALTEWRVKHGNIDPAADATMLLSLVGQIEGELNAAQINLDKIRSLGNPEHPMLRPAQEQVKALQKRLAETRRRMSGEGNTEASLLKDYEELKNAQTFADSNLTAAQQSYQQAFTDSLRLQRYLSVIVKPLSTDLPTSTSLPLLLMAALAVGLALALGVRVGSALLRDLRHG